MPLVLNQDIGEIVATTNLLLFTAPFETGLDFPDDDDVDWGVTWGSPWSEKGLTDGGLKFSVTSQQQEIPADQLIDPALILPSGRDVRIGADLLQMTVQNLYEGSGLGTVATPVAPGVSTRGHEQLDIDSTVDINYFAAGLDLKNPGDAEAFRFFAPKGFPVGGVQAVFGKNAAGKIGFELRCLPDPDNSNLVASVRDIIAATG